MPEKITSLEEAAQAHAVALADVRAAERLFERVRGPYDAARDRLHEAREQVKIIEAGMEAVTVVHATQLALADAGVEFDGPPLVTMVYGHRERLRVFFLVAVGPKGTGLYRFKPERSHRYQGVEHVVPRAAAVAHGHDPEEPRPHYREVTTRAHVDAGLVAWQERGKGDFGRNGGFRPMAPPEGGKWKWLKVRPQESLTTGTEG